MVFAPLEGVVYRDSVTCKGACYFNAVPESQTAAKVMLLMSPVSELAQLTLWL